LGGEAGVAAVDHIFHPQQGGQVIGRRSIRPLRGSQQALRCSQSLLDGQEIVFGVGKGQPKGGVGVGMAVDVRHAPLIAHDFDVILRPQPRKRGRVWPLGPERPEHKRTHAYQHNQQDPLPGLAQHISEAPLFFYRRERGERRDIGTRFLSIKRS
jgi:hypothetical protein